MTNAEYLNVLTIIKDEIWDAHYALLSKIDIDHNNFISDLNTTLKIQMSLLEKEIDYYDGLIDAD